MNLGSICFWEQEVSKHVYNVCFNCSFRYLVIMGLSALLNLLTSKVNHC